MSGRTTCVSEDCVRQRVPAVARGTRRSAHLNGKPDQPDIHYCARCALMLIDTGMFVPDEPIRWQDITPKLAADLNLDLSKRTDITAPLNEEEERCPWPWEPQQLKGAPMGQYRCSYCYAMCMAGLEHPDYTGFMDLYEADMRAMESANAALPANPDDPFALTDPDAEPLPRLDLVPPHDPQDREHC